jgi:hypothetical protein
MSLSWPRRAPFTARDTTIAAEGEER